MELNTGSDPETLLKVLHRTHNKSDSLFNVHLRVGMDYAIENNLWYWQAQFNLSKSAKLIKGQKNEEAIKQTLEVQRFMLDHDLSHSNLVNRMELSLSVSFQNIGQYNEAILHRLNHIGSLYSSKFDIRFINSYNAIGKMYLMEQGFDSAIVYYKKSLDYSGLWNKRIPTASTTNNIGLVFFEQRMFDSAEVYFNESLQLFAVNKNRSDSLMLGIVGGNLAKCFDYRTHKSQIEQLLNGQIRMTKKYLEYPSLANGYFDLANLYYETKQYDIAKTYLDSALQVNKLRINSLSKSEMELNIFEAYVQLYNDDGQLSKALGASAHLMYLNDSLYGKSQQDKLVKSISNYKVSGIQNELKSTLKEIELLEAEERLSKLKLTLFGSVGLLLLGLFILIILKMKSDQKKKQEIERLSKLMLEASIENKTNRLTQAALSLQRKVDFSKSLITKLGEMEGVTPKNLSPIKLFVNNEMYLDESLTEMENYVSELSQDFFATLKFKFPHLTENDVKLCGLIRLNLSIKEIAIIKNITPNSVKIAKNRLSKKMELAPGTSLFNYLKSITPE